ncbi:MAG TPA: ABC transporter substrate-binding protein [Candidatus Brocadiales bacterium]|nr:ABC transporter substrate-binding protein [Candidatus Brocadiales bacterium]
MRFYTVLLIIILSSNWCFASTQANVSVIFSSDIEPYQQTWEGIKKVFKEMEISLNYSEYHLERQKPDLIFLQITEENPDVVFTIGPQSIILAKEKVKNNPVIFSMVLNPEEIINSNITGVSLDIPISIKLKYIKRILPDVKVIGVIYTSKTIPVYKEMLQSCKEQGFQLIGKEIRSGKEFKDAFEDVSRQIDSFLMIPDTQIYFQQSIKYLLLEGLRKKLPIIGLSSAYTKAGALVSFDNSYRDIGKQAGEIALRVLEGEKPENIAPARPRTIQFSLNLLVAERLGITIPSDIIKESSEVFGK